MAAETGVAKNNDDNEPIVAMTGDANNNDDTKDDLLADQVMRLRNTIRACDRLCLLSARTLVQCGISDGRPDAKEPPRIFIPSVSRDLHSATEQNLEPDVHHGGPNRSFGGINRHPTTSAQCITALQCLLPLVGRFHLGTPMSKDQAFHPIERSTLKAFEPSRVAQDVRAAIDGGLEAFLYHPQPTLADDASADDAAEARAAEESLTSDAFGHLHPVTAAYVLRAIAPSRAQFTLVWWRSLFIVLWFLFRRAGGTHGHPNTQSTSSPGTAFLTSKCLDAIEMVLDIFERRRRRFQKLIGMIRELKDVQANRLELHELPGDLITAETFDSGFCYKEQNLIADIRACIREIAADTSLPLYHDWTKELDKKVEVLDNCDGADRAVVERCRRDFLAHVSGSFTEAVGKSEINKDRDPRKLARRNIDQLQALSEIAGATHRVIKDCLQAFAISDFDTAALRNRGEEVLQDLDKLPRWLCSGNYWKETRRLVGSQISITQSTAQRASQEVHWQSLEYHWRRHHDAAEMALTTANAFYDYLNHILATFETIGKPSSISAAADADGFLMGLSNAAEYLYRLRHQISRVRDTGVKWAETLMNRHLSDAVSGVMTQFDPGELAHAVRSVCVRGATAPLEIMIKALQVVCMAQRADGTWGCQQPFYWTETGFAAPTSSIETAWAVVSAVNEILSSAEQFGASSEDVSTRLKPVYTALDRFFRWLSRTLQSFPSPPALLQAGRAEPPLYGWCSDRAPEPGRIHSWNTACAIEYLVEFRRLLQERINSLLRSRFLSHHPAELTPLSDVEPTDLANLDEKGEKRPVISQLLELLREHKALGLAEGPWLPSEPPKATVAFWSCLLYGPPGTSKTFLAKAIAGELGWPLVSLSPSDFLARGVQNIESCAQEIFASLAAGSRLVYFFDEIDEMIRERRKGEETRSVFSFLTPSFLTKLQDLRDAAKTNEFIFVLGTNYFDRIDSAAKRAGRIDREFLVVYPDLQSRGYIILRHLLQARCTDGAMGLDKRYVCLKSFLQEQQKRSKHFAQEWGGLKFIDVFAQFTAFISYPKLMELNKRLSSLDDEEDVKALVGTLREIAEGRSLSFKPEISLSDYSRRGIDALEEISRIANLLPNKPFPESSDASTRARQLNELYNATKDNELRSKLHKKYSELIETAKTGDAGRESV
jgi:hypothetical protein